MERRVYRNTISGRRQEGSRHLLARLGIQRHAREPLYRQIAAGLRAEMEAGRLPPGTRLPSTREVARGLGVNLITAVSAYRELIRMGLAQGQIGRGTFATRPEAQEGRVGMTGQTAPTAHPILPSPGGLEEFVNRWDLPAIPQSRATMFFKRLGKDVIALSSGLPAADFFPMDAFRRAMEAVLRREGNAALQYQPMEGFGPLREAVAAYLGSRGTPVRTEELVICSGAVTGVHLVARLLTLPGDVVLTENPTYCGCLSALESLGLKLIGVPVDRGGMRLDVAERLVRQHRPKAIYTIPTYNNPTGVCLSRERRQALLALCQREGLRIIEEDYATEIGFTGPPPETLKAMDTAAQVIYVKSFAKLVFPSIRAAAIAAPPSMIRGLLSVKEGIDPYSSGLNQRVLRELMIQPGFARHANSLAGKYRPRYEAMGGALREAAGRGLTWMEPEGGVHVWLRLPGGLNSQDLLGEAVEAGVAFTPGHCFTPDRGGSEFLRLSFGNVTPDQIHTGVSRLGKVIRRHLDRQRRRRHEAQAVSATMML